jgi:uncharacterized protein YkwD
LTDLWVDCPDCGGRYGSYLSSCPQCGRASNFASRPEKSRKSVAGAAAIAIVVVIAVIALVFLGPGIPSLLSPAEELPTISILPPFRQEPRVVPQEELVNHALELINKDRASFGLEPVKLSSNAAAQIHAEDVFRNKQISHWMSNGEKPYMTYSKYGGSGGMGQNVAIAGFSKAQYDLCVQSTLYDCETIDPLATLQELQYQMMYNDTQCCGDGHRNNILNKYRTDVSIGIVYDRYYLAFVQNFENNYGLDISIEGGSVEVSGVIEEGVVDQIAIRYDAPPTSQVYETNKRMLAYSGGELVAVVVKPLPPGFFYEQPRDYRLMVASEWEAGEGQPVGVSFNLARAVSVDGVYTISVIAKGAGDETFEAASHTVFVNSDSDA